MIFYFLGGGRLERRCDGFWCIVHFFYLLSYIYIFVIKKNMIFYLFKINNI